MKTNERHHLKDNELALALGQAQTWAEKNQKTLIGIVLLIVVVGGGIAGYSAWTRRLDNQARTKLAEAMVIEEARVMPPGPPAGTTNDPNAIPGQAPGTYPTQKAKLEVALPKFLAVADEYPKLDSGHTARYHAATVLVTLGRFDEAVKQYDTVIAASSGVLQRMARLGKAEAQLSAGQFDPAIAALKEASEQADSPLPPDALLMELARAYRLAGKTEDARKTLTQVVEKHAESPLAADAKAEIEKLKG
jgi:predicted negative regulator of RcsB-dependent stress response